MQGLVLGTHEVRAVQQGLKTRLTFPVNHFKTVKAVHGPFNDPEHPFIIDHNGNGTHPQEGVDHSHVACPLGNVGDRLYIKEIYAILRYSLDYETGGEASYYEWDKDIYGPAEDSLNSNPRGGDAALVCYMADGRSDNPCDLYPTTNMKGTLRERAEIPWLPPAGMPAWASRLTVEITSVRAIRLWDTTENDVIEEGFDYDQNKMPDEEPLPWYEFRWKHQHGWRSWNQNRWVWEVKFKVVEGKK